MIIKDFKLLLSTKEEPLALVENWLKQETKQLLAWLISWTEDLIRIKLMTQHIFNQDLAETLFKIADQFQIQTLFRFSIPPSFLSAIHEPSGTRQKVRPTEKKAASTFKRNRTILRRLRESRRLQLDISLGGTK